MICREVARRAKTTASFEHRFHSTRRWRFDAAFPEHKIAVEIDGGVWTQGRHTRGSGFMRDQEKTNAAALLGWRVFRFVPSQLDTGEVMATLEIALGLRE
jgi:very-short-patch-repair endonuclease